MRTVPDVVDFGLTPLNAAKDAAQRAMLDAWGLTSRIDLRAPAAT